MLISNEKQAIKNKERKEQLRNTTQFLQTKILFKKLCNKMTKKEWTI